MKKNWGLCSFDFACLRCQKGKIYHSTAGYSKGREPNITGDFKISGGLLTLITNSFFLPVMYLMHSSRRLVHLRAVWNDQLIEIQMGPVFFYEKGGVGKHSGWSTPHKHQMFVSLVVIDELHPLLLIILHIWALQLHVGVPIGALQLKKSLI